MDLPQPGLRFASRGAYRAWAEQQPRGRFERERGVVVAMAPERLVHTRLKANAWLALRQALLAKAVPCEALMDGVTVEIGEDTDYEPDAVVTCGERAPDDATAAPNPVIIVEVMSPSTGYRDLGAKLADYFSVPSVQHHVAVFSDRVRVIHHRRVQDGQLLTSIVTEGVLQFDPPDISVAVAAIDDGPSL